MDTKTKLEIIDFYQPQEDNKNLYVTNIVYSGCSGACNTDILVHEALYNTFSRFGLLFEVQVFTGLPSRMKPITESTSVCEECNNAEMTSMNFYAFVKFFSIFAAQKAKQELHLTSFIGKETCRVSFAQRKKRDEERRPLYSSRCKDLANFYLGFNGWSSSVKLLGEDISQDLPQQQWSCELVYMAEISLTRHPLKTVGMGVCEEVVQSPSSLAKIQAKAICHKRALERATQNAFSKLLLVVLSNGKVFPEVDTTQEDLTHYMCDPGTAAVQVNDLDAEPEEESEEEVMEGSSSNDISTISDYVNVGILQELQNN